MTQDLTAAESTTSDDVVEASAVIEGDESTEAGVTAAIISDGAYTLFIADYDDTDSAWAAYETLKTMEDGTTVKLEGVVVVKREEDGKLSIQKATDASTKKGLKWGLIGGAALGLVFPPSILGGAAVAGALGAATGKVRELRNRSKLAADLEDAIKPGHSGIIALVSDPGVVADPRGADHGQHDRERGRRRRHRTRAQGGGEGCGQGSQDRLTSGRP